MEEGQYVEIDERMLCINNVEAVPDLWLLNDRVPRQLVISDSCRSRLGATISGIPGLEEEILFDEEEFFTGREIFDSCILKSPLGKTIIHATQDGQPARDSRNGGRFTLALLQGALQWQSGHLYSSIPVEDLVEYAEWALSAEDRRQVPDIPFREGALTVPIAIETAWPMRAPEVTGNQGLERAGPKSAEAMVLDQVPETTPVSPWLVLGGLLATIWLLSDE